MTGFCEHCNDYLTPKKHGILPVYELCYLFEERQSDIYLNSSRAVELLSRITKLEKFGH
jgi:hypothetical protein